MAGEKTEQATPKRKQDERKKGNIFQSREVVTVASLLIMYTSLKMLIPTMANQLTGFIRRCWGYASLAKPLTQPDGSGLLINSIIVFAICAMPLLLIAGLVAVIFTFAQTKMLVSTKSMAFKFNRLNPLSGIKRMFSIRGLVELLKSVLKITILGIIIYKTLEKFLPRLPLLFDVEPIQAVLFLEELLTSLINTAAAIFVFLAVADYVYQWWEYEKNLRMSKDEIKQEYKQTEGDPQVKGKIKEKQRQMAMSRMMQSVPTADVVVRNPTHYAIAIKYDPQEGNAPRVVAKGVDLVAFKIVEVAEQYGVTVSENVPLARALYAEVELGWEIPEKFYQPVAEVLAFVYNLKKRKIPTANNKEGRI